MLLADRENPTRDDLRLITMDAVPEPVMASAEVDATDVRDFPGYL